MEYQTVKERGKKIEEREKWLGGEDRVLILVQVKLARRVTEKEGSSDLNSFKSFPSVLLPDWMTLVPALQESHNSGQVSWISVSSFHNAVRALEIFQRLLLRG